LRATVPAPAAPPTAAAAAATCPVGKLGNLKLSRLILGSNLITFYIHSRGLKFVNTLARHYNTEEKILETLAIAESHGINTIMTQADAKYLSLLKKYRDQRGGKLQWIVAPGLSGTPEDVETINRLADEGAAAMYIHGAHADKFCSLQKRDAFVRALDTIKLCALPAGVGAHDLNVIRYCEKEGVGAEFYVKTFHHHRYPGAPKPDQLDKPHSENPGYWDRNPTETADVMRKINKPWIAFKVMAAGAIPPQDAFKYAFQNGADFILAGMFDFEIADDVAFAAKAYADAAKRARAWGV
jgi:hypothetical protein